MSDSNATCEETEKQEFPDLVYMLCKLSGQTPDQLFAQGEREKVYREAVNAELNKPAKRRCLIEVTTTELIDIDCDGCSSDDGKVVLFQKAMESFADRTGKIPDLEYDDIKLTVWDCSESLFDSTYNLRMTLDYCCRCWTREKNPDATPLEALKYRGLAIEVPDEVRTGKAACRSPG